MAKSYIGGHTVVRLGVGFTASAVAPKFPKRPNYVGYLGTGRGPRPFKVIAEGPHSARYVSTPIGTEEEAMKKGHVLSAEWPRVTVFGHNKEIATYKDGVVRRSSAKVILKR